MTDHSLHFDPSCEECAYLARPVAIPVPPAPVPAAGLRDDAVWEALTLVMAAPTRQQAEIVRAALLDEPVPPKSPYRDADEHERQSLAGTHLFDAACFWCLLGWYEHPPEAEPVPPCAGCAVYHDLHHPDHVPGAEPVPLDWRETYLRTLMNEIRGVIADSEDEPEAVKRIAARLTDPKGATDGE